MSLFGTRTKPPAAGDAVHLWKRGNRAVCGVDLSGETEMPAGTAVTCPVCNKKAAR